MQRYGPVHRHIQQDILRVVKALDVRSILDVGCGSGENLALLHEVGRYELAGADISSHALELARKRLPRAEFSVLDIEATCLDRQFDLVISVQAIEHVADDIAALRNIARMSRRYVFISTMAGRMRRSEVSIGHLRNYSRVELETKLQRAGLYLRWTHRWGFPFYSPMFRSLVELAPGGPPSGRVGPLGRGIAGSLYQLYRLNVPGRGDVLSALATIDRPD
jgi:SAM-dependent methyltransferase